MGDTENITPQFDNSQKGYALSGKIMLSAIVILFVVVILMVSLHIYARWYLLRVRRRQLRRRNRRRSQLVFYVDTTANQARGLDASLLNSLPVHVYSANTNPEMLECAVCISEFKENEKVRVLPKCNHSFHIECIDMWFHSHSTCPLCRTAVDGQIPAPVPQSQIEIVISAAEVPESVSDTESGLCASCQHDAGSSGTSSGGARRKPLELIGVTIAVPPRRNESGDVAALSSPASQAFKSPVGRMRSLKRMLSRDRKSAQSSSTVTGTSCAEFDEEASQVSRTQTQM